MLVHAFIPISFKYNDFDKSLTRFQIDLSGRNLLSRTISILNSIDEISETFIFCSNEKITEIPDKECKFAYANRSEDLDSEDASIESIIEEFIKLHPADIFILIHPKSPFIKSDSIRECINKVIKDNFDSAFTAKKYEKIAWFENKKVNLGSDCDTPRPKNLKPIFIENSGVYVFRQETFKNLRQRIGENPFIKIVNHFEGFEIEMIDDYEIAELIINAGLDKK